MFDMDTVYMVFKTDILKKWVVPIGILLCGIVLCPVLLDRANTPRHIIWCLTVLTLVLITKEIRIGTVHYFLFGYLAFVLFSGFFAINKSEWCYWVARLLLVISYMSVVEIDKKLLAKFMMVLGVVFTLYFWWEYLQKGQFLFCRGLMRQRNTSAVSMFFIIPFCYYAIKEKFWRTEAYIVAALMATQIVLLNSRSSILALMLSAGIVIVSIKKIRWTIIPIGLFGVVFIFTRGSLVSLQHRFEQWKYTMDMIIAHPFGVGAGNWWILFPKYAAGIDYHYAFKEHIYRFPHNDFLWILAETSIGGLICYLGIFAVAIRSAIKDKQTWLVMGIVGGMSVAFFSVLRERPFPTLMLMTFVLLACDRPYKIKQPKILLTVLIFAMIVFGCQLRSSYWNKLVRKSKDNVDFIERSRGYTIFSTLTYTGIPWQWYKGVTNLESGKPSLGISQIEEAYEYNPYNVYVLDAMGDASMVKRDKVKANEYFDEVLRICPRFEVEKR